MTAVRRLTAILAADVAGYSRLMGEDEAGTALAVREHREAGHADRRRALAAASSKLWATARCSSFPRWSPPSMRDGDPKAGWLSAVQRCPRRRRIALSHGAASRRRADRRRRYSRATASTSPRGWKASRRPAASISPTTPIAQVRGKVAAEFVDLGEQRLKNIARPVRVYSGPRVFVVLPRTRGPRARRGSLPGPQRGEKGIILGCIAPRLSIVVLPFQYLSGDPKQDYFVDGITDNLTTDLSRIRNSFVIARNTAFTYKGKAVDAKKSARSSVSVTSSKVPCSAMAIGSGLTPNSSTPRAGHICGPTASRKTSPTCSSCRTMSSPGWRTRLATNW